jgi:hypothetical protein
VIAINLLPVREWKKREAVRQQVSIFFLSIVLLLCMLFAVGFAIQGKISSRRAELKRLEAQKAQLAYVNTKIKQVQQKNREIEIKFKAIKTSAGTDKDGKGPGRGSQFSADRPSLADKTRSEGGKSETFRYCP